VQKGEAQRTKQGGHSWGGSGVIRTRDRRTEALKGGAKVWKKIQPPKKQTEVEVRSTKSR